MILRISLIAFLTVCIIVYIFIYKTLVSFIYYLYNYKNEISPKGSGGSISFDYNIPCNNMYVIYLSKSVSLTNYLIYSKIRRRQYVNNIQLYCTQYLRSIKLNALKTQCCMGNAC